MFTERRIPKGLAGTRNVKPIRGSHALRHDTIFMTYHRPPRPPADDPGEARTYFSPNRVTTHWKSESFAKPGSPFSRVLAADVT